MKNTKINAKTIQEALFGIISRLNRYVVVLFLILITALYGFVLWRISTLTSVQPSADQVSTQIKAAATPHIDPTVVKQMQALQDNSVNVKALFNQARSNPFNE